jgi:Raf kinase inhibitor-like YbhB/YbcL family protein
MRSPSVFVMMVICGVAGASRAQAQVVPAKPGPAEDAADVDITTHILQPRELTPPDPSTLKVPPGFRVTRFAQDLGNIRILVVAPNGDVYATRRDEGDVILLKDHGPSAPPAKPVRVASRSGVHGLALHDGKAYLATVHEIFRADVRSDGQFGPLEMLIHDLPDAGQHNTRTVQIGPDGMMYISVGSTCNECAEPNPEAATILRGSLDGKSRAVFASGLRDTIGWAWHPETGELWGMDHGIDWWGDAVPPEELNHIEKGKFYGWPYFYADNKMNPRLIPPGGIERSEYRAASTPMVLGYTPHAAPMQMVFYTGAQFPPEYRGDAFIAFHGSWNRKPSSGYEVVRIRFQNGQPTAFEPFLTGFLRSNGEVGRPFGAAVAHDGSLLVGDDRNGAVYRVSYTAAADKLAAPPSAAQPPAAAMQRQAEKGAAVPLAIARPETKSAHKLVVTSSAFKSGGTLPATFSAYEQDNSFPLAWTGAPPETKSFVLIMEDPDAKKPTPHTVIHWVAWNIPPTTTSLREGLQKQDGLDDPDGMRQGPGTSGTVGYRGPKPPLGDPPHHYHVQIFALDRTLDLPPHSGRDDVLQAARGHVLASGEIVATFKRPDKPSRP